jgi:hypothetical protein
MFLKRKKLLKLSLALALVMTVTACAAVISSRPLPQEYTPAEQQALAAELDKVCPLSVDEFGNEVHSCPMIDRVISDYRVLRKKLKVR